MIHEQKYAVGGVFEKNTITIQDLIADMKNSMDITKAGAIFTFSGTVRESSIHSVKKVKQIEVEIWEEKATDSLISIATKIKKDFGLIDIKIWHSFGTLELGEDIVFVVVSSSHRDNGLDSIKAAINEYKKIAPIWKKEIFEDGTSEWISGKDRNSD